MSKEASGTATLLESAGIQGLPQLVNWYLAFSPATERTCLGCG